MKNKRFYIDLFAVFTALCSLVISLVEGQYHYLLRDATILVLVLVIVKRSHFE